MAEIQLSYYIYEEAKPSDYLAAYVCCAVGLYWSVNQEQNELSEEITPSVKFVVEGNQEQSKLEQEITPSVNFEVEEKQEQNKQEEEIAPIVE